MFKKHTKQNKKNYRIDPYWNFKVLGPYEFYDAGTGLAGSRPPVSDEEHNNVTKWYKV